VAIAYAAALYALVFAPAAIAALKGRAGWLLAGLLFSPFVWWYAALQLALPGSWWEMNRSGPEKRAASHERYRDKRAKGWLVGVALASLVLPFAAGFLAALLID
jgi:hypothetical protein